MGLPRLIYSAVRCNDCNTVIMSKTVHDFVECPCHNTFIDGGLDYCRYGGTYTNPPTMLSKYVGGNTVDNLPLLENAAMNAGTFEKPLCVRIVLETCRVELPHTTVTIPLDTHYSKIAGFFTAALTGSYYAGYAHRTDDAWVIKCVELEQ